MKSPERKPFHLYKSTNSSKKWDVYVPSQSGRMRKVAFGARGMSDYTHHKDKERRSRYRARHANDHIDDPYKPGFWSWFVLWGDSSDLKTAFQHAVRKAKRLL
jgi:hypothetical protein